ncbi:winged helix-turn-helix transcriptional regulator [Nocardioides sp. B-3]|nr:hypothetical protein [Nocardioides sp. B-3]UUZ58235.1 hypothetical protein LP418_18555 [Nocardioides sp. B-3]
MFGTCSVAQTLEFVGTKWTLLVVRELLLGNHRFRRDRAFHRRALTTS